MWQFSFFGGGILKLSDLDYVEINEVKYPSNNTWQVTLRKNLILAIRQTAVLCVWSHLIG